MNIINKKMYKKTIQLVDSNSADSLLDIGYGNGYLINRLYKKTKSHIYGIDISNDMKNKAISKNKRALRDNKLHLSIGDCCSLEFDDNRFKYITSINTIYFWNDTVLGLKEIRRALMPGSTFYNVVYSKEWLDKLSYTNTGFKKFELDDYIKLGEEAGFTNIKIEEIVKNKSYVIIYTK